MVTSAKLSVGLGSHASVAVAVAKLGVAGHWIVLGPGKLAITGAVVSSTLIVWLAVALFPHASVAVQVRVTLYSCGQAPGAVTSANVTTGLGSHRSFTVGAGKLGVAGHSIDAAGAQVIVGAVLSVTEIVWLQLAAFPHASVAVQVRT